MAHAGLDPDTLLAEGRALRHLARSLLGRDGRGVADADDLLQEAQLAAVAAGAAERGVGAWLAGTMRNLAKMLRRGEARRRRREEGIARDQPVSGMDPCELAQRAEWVRDLAIAVVALDEPFRSAIVMRYWHGLSPLAIAAQLGVSHNTVRSRLQRGLERLRARLDDKHGSRAGWLAPLGALASLPETKVGGAAMVSMSLTAVVGVLMQTKMLVLAVATMVVAAVWWSWPVADAGEHAGPSREPAALVAVAATGGVTTAAAAAPPREAAAPPVPVVPADEPPFDPTPVRVPPWTANLLVVDGDEMPVPGATITIWPGKKVERSADVRRRMGGARHSYSGREEQPLRTVVTDADGRARPVLELENVVVAAAMAGFRDSRADVIWYTREAGTKLVVVTECTVRGVVLHADGTPAASAEVRAAAGGAFDDIAKNPEPVMTDAAGRFALAVQRHGTWVFLARFGGQDCIPLRRTIRDDGTDLVLRFPGAIALVGRVVDAAGRGVAAAQVKAWRAPPANDDPARDDEAMRSTMADAQGAFVLPVRSLARYQVLASADGQCRSALVVVATSAERPRAEVTLELPAAAPIRGRVVHADGSPFAGVRIGASPELAPLLGAFEQPDSRDLCADVDAVTTAADGGFTLAVQPATKWTLRLRPDRKRPLVTRELRGVVAGTTDLEVTIAAVDLEQCIVRGAVVRAADGSALTGFTATLVTHDERGPLHSGGASIRIDGNRFATEPLPVGRRFGFWIEPKATRDGLPVMGELGWTEVLPFETRPGTVDVEVRVAPWGELPVRVLGPGDVPVRNARATANAKAWFGRSQSLQHVDAAGGVVLRWLGAGNHRVVVLRGASEVVFDQDVMVASGRNPELVVRVAK